MSIDFTVAAELKKAVSDRFGSEVHFHDGCGGQYFTLEESNAEIENYISEFFTEKGLKTEFSGDGLRFTAEKS